MLDEEELKFRAFEAPYLGMPLSANYSTRCLDSQGRFLELFVYEDEFRLNEVGFLTDAAFEAIIIGSFWCEMMEGRDAREALQLRVADLLDKLPSSCRENPAMLEAAELCVRAGRLLLRDIPGV